MTASSLDRLAPVVRTLYQAEHAAVRDLLEAEARCRRQLARLDALAQSARAVEPGPMQLIGADVAFRRNLDAQRVRLNRDLARILARKADAMDKVRRAFGRCHAVEAAAERLALKTARDRAARRAEAALAPWLAGPTPG